MEIKTTGLLESLFHKKLFVFEWVFVMLKHGFHFYMKYNMQQNARMYGSRLHLIYKCKCWHYSVRFQSQINKQTKQPRTWSKQQRQKNEAGKKSHPNTLTSLAFHLFVMIDKPFIPSYIWHSSIDIQISELSYKWM